MLQRTDIGLTVLKGKSMDIGEEESGGAMPVAEFKPVIPISREQYNWLMNGLNIYKKDGFSEVLARKVI